MPSQTEPNQAKPRKGKKFHAFIFGCVKFQMLVQFVCVNVSQCNNTLLLWKLKLHIRIWLFWVTITYHKINDSRNKRNARKQKRQEKWQKNYTQFTHSRTFIFPSPKFHHICSSCWMELWAQLSLALKRN